MIASFVLNSIVLCVSVLFQLSFVIFREICLIFLDIERASFSSLLLVSLRFHCITASGISYS